jgi:hypothetical protein
MGLELVGEYTITAKCMDTVAEQTIKEFCDKEKKMTRNIIEKETRNSNGISVKLLGSTFTLTEGYPSLLFDAVLVHMNRKTTTLFNAFLCSATSQQHMDLFDSEVKNALRGVEFFSFKNATPIPEYIKMFPEFMTRCGFTMQKEGEHTDVLERLKSVTSNAYEKVLELPPSDCPLEELQDYLINELSSKEHMVFAQLGLSVPTKCQKAMFTLMAEQADLEKVSTTGIKGLKI